MYSLHTPDHTTPHHHHHLRHHPIPFTGPRLSLLEASSIFLLAHRPQPPLLPCYNGRSPPPGLHSGQHGLPTLRELHQGELALISHPEDRLAAYFFQHIGGRGTCGHLMCVTEMGLIQVCYLMPALILLRMQNPGAHCHKENL